MKYFHRPFPFVFFRKSSPLFIAIFLFCGAIFAQPPVEWTRCYGGSESDVIMDVLRTEEGGWLLMGGTTSDDGDVSGYHGEGDIWIVKLDAAYNIEWERAYGTNLFPGDELISGVPAVDSGWVILGKRGSFSIQGPFLWGDADSTCIYLTWMFKISPSGAIEWQSCIGMTQAFEYPADIIVTKDSTYLVASTMHDALAIPQICGSTSDRMLWVAEVSPQGNILNQQCVFPMLFVKQVAELDNGGYLFLGNGDEDDPLLDTLWGNHDLILLKTDSAFNPLWAKAYGGTEADFAREFIQTSDGGYMILASSESQDGMVSNNHGSVQWVTRDIWLVKVDSQGNLEWEKCYGGTNNDTAWDIVELANGTFTVIGQAVSNDGDPVGGSWSFPAAWFFNLDSTGSFQWNSGWPLDSVGNWNGIRLLDDCGYLAFGGMASNSHCSHGSNDYGLVRMAYNNLAPTVTFFSSNILISSATTDNQWYFNGDTIPGENSRYLTITQDGWYMVSVTIEEGCTFLSDSIYVTLLASPDSLNEATFDVFPQPADTDLKIRYKGNSAGTLRISVFDIHGRKLVEKATMFGAGNDLTEVSLRAFSAGYYLLKLETRERASYYRFVKQ